MGYMYTSRYKSTQPTTPYCQVSIFCLCIFRKISSARPGIQGLCLHIMKTYVTLPSEIPTKQDSKPNRLTGGSRYIKGPIHPKLNCAV
jgi:hypothetical protein